MVQKSGINRECQMLRPDTFFFSAQATLAQPILENGLQERPRCQDQAGNSMLFEIFLGNA
jgi:hypothetical protein